MAVDWDRHWSGAARNCRSLHEWAGRLAGEKPRIAAAGLKLDMIHLAARCRSRHVPEEMRRAFPGIPWSDLDRWWLFERKRYDTCGGFDGPSPWPMLDFGLRVAPGLADEFGRLREWAMERGIEAEGRDGVLSVSDSEGGWTTMTVRVPTARAGEVLGALDRALAGEAVLTLDAARARLAAASGAIAALGVEEIAIYGSVGDGRAKPGSDVDLTYRLAEGVERAWSVWSDLVPVLEGALGKVVDAHEVRGAPDPLAPPATVVWTARR